MEHDLSLRGPEARSAPVATLCAMFDHAVATAPDKVALRHSGVALTYREVGRAVAALARRLAPIVTPGEVVALVLPNSIEFHVAYFAALKVLAVPALLNPHYPAIELSPLLRKVSPRAVVCAPATRDTVAGLADDLGIPRTVCLGQEIEIRELFAQAEAPLELRSATSEDPGALFFSGGTTGLPKAIEQTHGRLVTTARCIQHVWPTRADGISSSSPSAIPIPARSTGTTVSFFPAMTGACMVVSGVSILRVVSGRLRVTSYPISSVISRNS